MRAAIVTREWPPEVYGGAGVHVTELVRSLRALIDVDVYCMGAQRSDALAFELGSSSGVNPEIGRAHV